MQNYQKHIQEAPSEKVLPHTEQVKKLSMQEAFKVQAEIEALQGQIDYHEKALNDARAKVRLLNAKMGM
jgi:hypothetical protein